MNQEISTYLKYSEYLVAVCITIYVITFYFLFIKKYLKLNKAADVIVGIIVPILGFILIDILRSIVHNLLNIDSSINDELGRYILSISLIIIGVRLIYIKKKTLGIAILVTIGIIISGYLLLGFVCSQVC